MKDGGSIVIQKTTGGFLLRLEDGSRFYAHGMEGDILDFVRLNIHPLPSPERMRADIGRILGKEGPINLNPGKEGEGFTVQPVQTVRFGTDETMERVGRDNCRFIKVDRDVDGNARVCVYIGESLGWTAPLSMCKLGYMGPEQGSR